MKKIALEDEHEDEKILSYTSERFFLIDLQWNYFWELTSGR
jgi:hypothetical protein